jgi:hypothetical protein
MNFIRFVILFIIALVVLKQLQPQKSNEQHMVTSLFVAIIAYIVMVFYYKEQFHFEVTPYKKTCIYDDRWKCPQCCPPGFNGMNVGFEYTSDTDRMNECPLGPYQNIKANPSDYDKLGQTWDYGLGKESFCQSCGAGSDRKKLSQTWAEQPAYEAYRRR